MTDQIELTFSTRQAIVLVFTVGFIVGGAGVGTIELLNSPTGAVTAGGGQNEGGGTPTPDTGNTDTNPGPSGSDDTDTVATSSISVEDEPTLGESDASVTIVEFSDYQCPFCRRFQQETLEQLRENYIDEGKVRLVYKDFPLTQLGHNRAPLMAQAALCAGEQGKYWEMHDKMFNEQQKLSPRGTAKFSADKVTQWAEDIEMDMDAFTRCVDSDRYRSEVQSDLSEGKSLGVSGTPTFFIYAEGDQQARKLVGAQPYSRFRSVIDSKLSADSGDQQDLKTWDTSKDDPRVIEVAAEQFRFSPSTLTAKQGEWIRLEATSQDVTHGLAIQEYGVNMQLQSGETVRSKPFRVTDTGTFTFACSVYCGSGHGGMQGTLEVTAP